MAVWQDFPRVETILDHLDHQKLKQGNTITEPATQPYTPYKFNRYLASKWDANFYKGVISDRPPSKGTILAAVRQCLKGAVSRDFVPTFFSHYSTYPICARYSHNEYFRMWSRICGDILVCKKLCGVIDTAGKKLFMKVSKGFLCFKESVSPNFRHF